VTAGQVATLDVAIDRDAPGGTLSTDPAEIWPPDGSMLTVTLSGDLTDVGTGISRVTFRVLDEYGTVEPNIEALDGGGTTAATFTRSFQIEAARRGGDRDGRAYTIEANVMDRACNTTTLKTTVLVLHDQRK
jgi:hypothetical protein